MNYDNDLKLVDLTDLKGAFPVAVRETIQVLSTTEEWERSIWGNGDSLGYPTVVRNDRGLNPDGRYYLYYAHHDVPSGIGCAVAETIRGPYRKVAELDPSRQGDSRVLHPTKDPDLCRNHLSSPCVLWNPAGQCWHLYFHTYHDLWVQGRGHQQTYLATCRDLSAHRWEIVRDPDGEWKIVLPTTREKWMNSESTYHSICVLPDGRFLAFLRGVGMGYVNGDPTSDVTKLGWATSRDGIEWDYFTDNPVIVQQDSNIGRDGVFRPGFVGALGNGEYQVVWQESMYYDSDNVVVYGTTHDFRTFSRDTRNPARWRAADGLISPWREDNLLYLFTGKQLHVMELPC